MAILSRVMSPMQLQVKTGQEDPGSDFNLAGAAGRAARTGSVFGGSDQGTTAFPPPWPGLGLNPQTDISRVKLAKMPAPTGSRGLPPAKAWQDWFTIRLRTWANVISPEFEAELVKKVQGQQADLSRHGAADRQRDLLQHRRQDVTIPAWRGPVVRLRDPESIAQRNPGQHGRAHGSASREVCQARSLQGQDEAVVDAETVAYRPQGVVGGRKLAIQRDSDAILEDGDGRNQRPQQRARNRGFACAG